MKKTQKGFATTLAIVVVALLAISLGVYHYSKDKSDTVLPEQASTTDFKPVANLDPAEVFLRKMLTDLNLSASIIPISKSIGFKGEAMRKEMAGYSFTTFERLKDWEYFSSTKGFKNDVYNSGDATFHSSSGYVSNSLICVVYSKVVAPGGDTNKCDGTSTSVCKVSSEVFCTGQR